MQLFVREHNRLCDHFRASRPELVEEDLFQEARRWTTAFIQRITFEEVGLSFFWRKTF